MTALFSQDKFQRAWNFASRAHKDQKVPGSYVPYLNHIGNVVMEVIAALSAQSMEKPDLAVQCAILHDVIEDSSVSFEEVKEMFGFEVAEGVSSLSKDKDLPTKMEQMEDSITRILLQPKEVQMVKLADRITNLQTPPSHWDGEKIKRYRKEATFIHEKLGKAHITLDERLKQKIDSYPPDITG